MKFTTERLIIRPLSPKDREAVFDYRSDKFINKYQGWIPKTIDDVDEFIAKIPSEVNMPETWFQWILEIEESSIIIGDLGVHFIDEESQQIEVGCTLSKEYMGKGFATEALEKIIDHAFNTW